MFERTLADLIRGLRASNKQDEATFIARAVDEIRNEVRSKDMELKAAAILKLTYLDMMGYDMSWASFNVVEVMSSSKLHLKSVGYLAAVQSFKEDTDVLMLTTNTLKKDIASPHPADIATALDGLSHIITPDIARDLSLDLIAMLNHSRPRIRKRAVLVMYRVFEKYPDAIPRSMTRLREKLDDEDTGVVSATVNILCELARRNPQQYLPLAPQLFDLLTKSSNNWMLIKLIKLLGALTPHEPRLAKKLHKPISELIATTPAVSLLYECVHTCIIGGMLQVGTAGSNTLAKTCVNKLSAFLSDPDQNLKYIALLALVKIVPTHPHLVAVHQNDILSSLDDQDLSIRMRALELVTSMATTENLKSIVQRLLSHLVPPSDDPESPKAALPSAAQALAQATSSTSAPPSAAALPNPNLDLGYRLSLSRRIISLCAQFAAEAYSDDSTDFDFAWYISVLVDLSYVAPASIGIGSLIRDQLLDVAVRVSDAGVRARTVELMTRLLGDDDILRNVASGDSERDAVEKRGGGEADVLWAAAWICGEYCQELAQPYNVLTSLFQQPYVHQLPERTQAAYLQSGLKIFGHWAAGLSTRWDDNNNGAVEDVVTRVNDIRAILETFSASEHIEVQERAANMLQLFAFVKADISTRQAKVSAAAAAASAAPTDGPSTSATFEPGYPKSLFLIQPLHARPLRPIPQAQVPIGSSRIVPTLKRLRVPVPEGLDLDAWIVPPPKSAVRHVDEDDENSPSPSAISAKRKKGKDKADATEGKTKTKKKKAKDGADASVSPALASGVSAEEVAARARRKAQLAEERRNDPYYLVDTASSSRPSPRVEDDVDSIPVVKLDLGLPSPSHSVPALRSLKTQTSYTSVRSTPPTPNIATTRDASPASTPPSSLLSSSILSSSLIAAARKSTPLSGGFAPYEADEDEIIAPHERVAGVSTPEPIKVTKVKKKKVKSTKSKSSLATPDI